MFNRNKRPVLTHHYCDQMEKLRLALEVLTERRPRFINIDFNTGAARVKIGSGEFDILFLRQRREDILDFQFKENRMWATARFIDGGSVGVYYQQQDVHDTTPRATWWVGTSQYNRVEKPIGKE